MANTRTSTSRKPRTAARAASRPSRIADQADAEPEVSEAEAQEIEAEARYITATLCGEEVQIVPPMAWRSSWQRLLNQGNLDGFAQAVLHPDDYELYLELDPTLAEFWEFTEDAGQQSGESLGKSHGPAAPSRRTRRR